MIVNNVAGLSGGGISLQDSAKVNIVHTTIANNDSTATAGLAFAPGTPNLSTPQVGGIIAHAHSPALAASFGNSKKVIPYKVFSNAEISNSIIWHNRSFYFRVDETGAVPLIGLLPDIDAQVMPRSLAGYAGRRHGST